MSGSTDLKTPSATALPRPHHAMMILALAMPASIVAGRALLAVVLALAALTAAAAWVRHRRQPVLPPHSRAVAIAAGVVALAWVPSVIGSLNPLASLGTLGQGLGMVTVAILAAALAQDDPDRRADRVFLAGMAAALIFAIVAITVAPNLLAFRAKGPIIAPLMLKASASAMVCALPVTLFLGWRQGGLWRLCAVLVVALGLALMALTHSKSSAAGLLAAVGVVGLLVATRRLAAPARWAVMIAAALAGAAALAWALSLTPPVTMGGYRQFAPVWLVDAHRQVIWQFALDRFAERPLTGWGLGVISSVAGAGNNIPELVGAEFIPSHTHNWIIHILSEAGLVGALPLIAVVLAVPVLLARRWGRDGDPALLVGLCLWVTYWAANLFNFSLWNTWWQGSLIVLIALIVPKSRRPQS